MAPHSPVTAALRQAGATMVARAGTVVPAHFGSSAGELAACSVGVGLADRSDLAVLELTGPVEALERISFALLGTVIAPGGALAGRETVWCSPEAGRLLAVTERGAPLRARLADLVMMVPLARLRDRSATVACLELLGPRTEATLAAAGVPATFPPSAHRGRVGPVEAIVIRRSWARALVLVRPADAVVGWTAIDRGGAASGITCVGADAVARFSFLEHRLTTAPVPG